MNIISSTVWTIFSTQDMLSNHCLMDLSKRDGRLWNSVFFLTRSTFKG